MSALYDKKGIPILPGDTLKVFHYIAARRRERRYLYKYVLSQVKRADGVRFYKISHLASDGPEDFYWETVDGRTLSNTEIVQGHGGVELGQDYRDRRRKA